MSVMQVEEEEVILQEEEEEEENRKRRRPRKSDRLSRTWEVGGREVSGYQTSPPGHASRQTAPLTDGGTPPTPPRRPDPGEPGTHPSEPHPSLNPPTSPPPPLPLPGLHTDHRVTGQEGV